MMTESPGLTLPVTAKDFPDWSNEPWRRLQRAVSRQAERVGITRNMLPLVQVNQDAMTVPENRILLAGAGYAIEEAPVTRLNEIWADFTLTPQQMRDEAALHTAAVLGEHVTQFLTEGQDALVFQGESALKEDVRFKKLGIRARSGPAGPGLLAMAPEDQVIFVKAESGGASIYGDRTFEAVAEGYRRLQAKGHDGPYVLAFAPEPYADAFAPIPRTQIMPARRIRDLLATLPKGSGSLAALTGVLVSLGGSSVQLVLGRDIKVNFLQEAPDGRYKFRVQQRFALRVQDPDAIVRFQFEAPPR